MARHITHTAAKSLTARDIIFTVLALSLIVAFTAVIIAATHVAVDSILSMGYPNAFGWDLYRKV